MFKRFLSKGIVLALISMVIVGAFVFNAISSGIVTPTVNLRDSNDMLRPTAVANHIESIVLGMGVEGLNSAYAKGGAKGLEKAIADLALANADDSLKKELTKENISIIEKDGKNFVVCSIGNGWRIEFTKGSELKTIAFASEKEKDEFMLGAQRTWVSMMGHRTPREIYTAQRAANDYIGQAAKEGRIFVEKGLEEQVKKYAKASGLTADTQSQLLNRLKAAIEFRNNAINSLAQSDVDEFFAFEKTAIPFDASDVSKIKKDLSDDLAIRKAIIFDAKDGIAFSLLGDLSALEYLTVTASSGARFIFEGYKGDFPRSIYEILGMTESYMEMANAGDQDALKAYKAKVLLHEYVVVNSQSKALRKEIPAVTNLINKYDRIAIANWIEREAKKVAAIEAKKTIAEATLANIGKFVKGGVITSELIDTANAELQKLVNLGLLTDYRVVNKDGKVSILTTRKNSKAVEDDAQIPSAIQDVYLQVLIRAQEKGIYAGENLADKSYRQQVETLEISTPLPTLTYLKPEGWAKLFAIRTELKVPEGQAKEIFTNVLHTYNISELLTKPLGQIPDSVVNAVREKLKQDVAEGKILTAVVNDFGGTVISVHVTHRYGELNAAVHRVALEAVKEGLLKAQDKGLLKQEIDVASMSLDDLAKELGVMSNEYSVKERDSEPVVMATIIGGGIGAANIKLYHQFFVPGSTPLQKLGLPSSPGFRAIVRRTEDILKGNFEGPAWEFETAEGRTTKDGKPIDSRFESIRLLALAGQPNDYQITEVYPVEGSKLPTNEALATVVYQPVYGKDGKLRALNPTIIYRSQSGADAVGGVGNMMVDANFVPGGEKGEHFVATKVVSLKEARRAPKEGIANVVVYGWMSKQNGVISTEEIGDFAARDPDAVKPYRNRADKLAKVMTTHKDDQPYIAPFAAQERVEKIRKQQAKYFERAPKEADIDPRMTDVEAKVASGEYTAVVDDKSDMGGDWGHQGVPKYMLAIYRATAIWAVEKGMITYGNIVGFLDLLRVPMGMNMGVGDDGHILMLGDKSRNSAEAHQLSFLAFTRAYLGAFVSGEKPYGLAQDYAGKEAKAAKANPYFYSKFDERFFEILREVMPNEYISMVDKMEKGWKEWQVSSKGVTLPPPFSGNVSSQGMGSARYTLDTANGEKEFDIVAADKAGPAGLNRIIREGVYAALAAVRSGKDKIDELVNGAVFEIWDAKAFDEHGNIPINELPELFADVADAITSLKNQVDQDFVKNSYADGKLKSNLAQADKVKLAKLLKQAGYVPAKRIYLDAEKDKVAIYLYLADSDRFNIKHVWSKRKAGWDINNPQAYLGKPLLGSSVTKLGILAGGEYIGKDDPVMVGNSKLMKYVHEFLRTNFVILQGDMNGSHWPAVVPVALKYAIATTDSHPIIVGLHYTVSEDGKSLVNVEDAYAKKEYSSIRRQIHEFNFLYKIAQLGGQFEPYGTNVLTVEASYPLAKLIREITAPNSPYLVKNKPGVRTIGLMGEIVDLMNTATGFLTMPSAPEDWTGADESAQKLVKSSLRLQSSGVSRKLDEDVFSAAKDITNQKVVLINASVLRSDPSLILTQQSINKQINQRLGVFGSAASIKANAFRFVLIPDELGLKTPKDIENLFAAIAKETNNGAVANKDMFAAIPTQEEMYEGKISNAADLLKQLERIGIKPESIAGLVGPNEWTNAIKAQKGISKDAISANTGAQENQIALASNALFGVVEAIARSDKQLPNNLALELDIMTEGMNMSVTSREVKSRIQDFITAYRETVKTI